MITNVMMYCLLGSMAVLFVLEMAGFRDED